MAFERNFIESLHFPLELDARDPMRSLGDRFKLIEIDAGPTAHKLQDSKVTGSRLTPVWRPRPSRPILSPNGDAAHQGSSPARSQGRAALRQTCPPLSRRNLPELWF